MTNNIVEGFKVAYSNPTGFLSLWLRGSDGENNKVNVNVAISEDIGRGDEDLIGSMERLSVCWHDVIERFARGRDEGDEMK